MKGRPSFHRATGLGLLGVFLAVAPALAADDVWVTAGQPSGGQIFKVVVDPATPSTLYALANPGVYKSTDSGAKWTEVLALVGSDGNDLAVDPVKPSNVYAANDNLGLWKSADGGKTWNHLGGVRNPHLVVADPVTEGTVYTITNGCDVYKSADGGATWSPTGVSGLTGNTQAYCTQIAVDPANTQQLYLAAEVGQTNTGLPGGSSLSGLYSSVDGGAHWTQNLPTVAFADVVIDPSNDQNVYAGNYVSNDGGATWAASTSTATDLTVIAVDPADSQVIWGTDLLASLWTSTDQGAHWSQVSLPQGNSIYNLAYDPGTPATLYASSMAFGVYKSTDGGSTWADSTDGITGVFPRDILADSTGAIYMGTGGTGVFKSTDGGATWVMKDRGFAIDLGASAIDAESLVEASTPGTLYETDENALYKTTDGGDTWAPLTSNVIGSITALAVDPEQANTVYAGAADGHVIKSVDGGATWTASPVSGLSGVGVASLAVDPTDSNVLFAGGSVSAGLGSSASSGLFKSVDGGTTWSKADRGMPVAFGVDCVAVDPETPTNVYACPGNAGIYKSTDGGQTWSKAGDSSDFAYRILQIDPNDPDVIYAAIPNAMIDVSTDGGATWNTLGQPTSAATDSRTEAMMIPGFSPKTRASSTSQPVTMSSIAVDPRRAGHLYGVADNGQVYSTGVKTAAASGGKGSGSSDASSGGGGFPLLGSLLLLGFAVMRRKH